MFADVSLVAYSALDAATIVTYDGLPDDAKDTYRAAAAAAGVPLIATIFDDSPSGTMAAVLADPASRAIHVQTVARLVIEGGFAGVDLDYEKFAFSDSRDTWAATSPNWIAFLTELAVPLRAAGKQLIVSVPPVYDGERTGASGYWVYDYAAMGEIVDRIRVMTYDYSFQGGDPARSRRSTGCATWSTRSPNWYHPRSSTSASRVRLRLGGVGERRVPERSATRHPVDVDRARRTNAGRARDRSHLGSGDGGTMVRLRRHPHRHRHRGHRGELHREPAGALPRRDGDPSPGVRRASPRPPRCGVVGARQRRPAHLGWSSRCPPRRRQLGRHHLAHDRPGDASCRLRSTRPCARRWWDLRPWAPPLARPTLALKSAPSTPVAGRRPS
ncbi:MAG: glycosyl hydrolase family 18 protein [Ilumatobacteraceae bacterium]